MRSSPGLVELDRRALLRRAMLLLGATMLPDLAAPALGARPRAGAGPLSRAHLDLVAAYADVVIPRTETEGAIGAGVPRAIDAMLRDWASAKTRGEFIAVLDALDGAAKAATGRPLSALPHQRRKRVVETFDAEQFAARQKKDIAGKDAGKRVLPAIAARHLANSEPSRVSSDKALAQQEKSSAGARLTDAKSPTKGKPLAPADDPVAALAGKYVRLKDLVLTTYYLSEPGATKELRYELIPGVWEASMPLGNDRRAWAV